MTQRLAELFVYSEELKKLSSRSDPSLKRACLSVGLIEQDDWNPHGLVGGSLCFYPKCFRPCRCFSVGFIMFLAIGVKKGGVEEVLKAPPVYTE